MSPLLRRNMILCAILAAMTAVLSQVVIPIGPVPINLATFAVFCAGGLLGSKRGAAGMAVYLALGIAGLPVFSMARGGVGVLAGPTGGYIIGYIAAAFVIGLILEKWDAPAADAKPRRGKKIYRYAMAMLTGMLIYFILGSAWYMFVANVGLAETLMVCVAPFIPGDLLKIAAAAAVCRRLERLLPPTNASS